jgi:hypothetical protein
MVSISIGPGGEGFGRVLKVREGFLEYFFDVGGHHDCEIGLNRKS